MDRTVTTGRLLLLLLVAWSTVACSSTTTFGNETDRLSLLDFKNSITFDPHQALASWNDSAHFCSWEGILCTAKHPNRVAAIHLERRGLVGQISPSLGNLTFLRNLSLSTNRLTGEIPASLGHMKLLRDLYLSNNMLQGRIPSFTNCSSVQVLWLDRNGLVGEFPAELPSSLRQLQVSWNNLTGPIPASLANVTTLTMISCAFNNLIGNIPDELARLSSMRRLYAGGNQLSGRFPKAVMNLSELTDLDLDLNQLTGEVPPDLGGTLRNLVLLELAANFFRGEIPPSLTNASGLYLLEVSRNNFTGVVSRTIGRLNKLQVLNLQYNQFRAGSEPDWEFLGSLANCTDLIYFSITGNHLQGQVPASLGNLTNELQYLYLAQNQLSGDFPPGIANLRNLIIVSLAFNQFTGVLSERLGTLKNLQVLSLGGNLFTGRIPSSLSNMSRLGELDLYSNRLVGQIPSSIGNLTMLQIVNIPNNRLHGSIPKELFRIPTIMQIRLAINNLDATLHPDIGTAKQLTYLQLSSNNLSGEIPSTLGSCESLQEIDLDNNALSGSIPASLSNLGALKTLNLSHNRLNGWIPASLGNLGLLEQLDLSSNNLEGQVPAKGIFKNATAIRIDGNQDLCGGPMELHLLACPVKSPDSGNHRLETMLKVLIPVAAVVSLAAVVSVLLLWRRKYKSKTGPLSLFLREFPKVSYNEIVRATEGFSTSNRIGQGRYGSVYQGKLFQDTSVVAIKVFSLETRGAKKSFIAECIALRNIRHRNLVPILTACSSIDSHGNDFKALVYKFMPQGDLHNLLYSTRDGEDSPNLNYISLPQRLGIAVNISDALAYLHHNNQGTIIHCDLKPSNILLNDDMVAHVGDFGLSKFNFDFTTSFADSNSTSSIAIKGTIGYVAPECAGGGHVSTASDVYSFGVVLLEIFIRRRPTDDMFKDGMSIASYAETNFPSNVLGIVDPQLLQELEMDHNNVAPVAVNNNGAQVLQSLLGIGLCCTKTSPSQRISMQEVAAKLHGIRDAYLRGN